MTVSADAIIGDARNYMIVYSISKDDGTAFEGIEPLENGVIPLMFECGERLSPPAIVTAHLHGAKHQHEHPARTQRGFRLLVSMPMGSVAMR